MPRMVVRQNDTGEPFALVCPAGDSGVDMTTAVSGVIQVQLPDGSTLTWAATLSGATVAQVTATHVFASGDLPARGFYSVFVELTLPLSAKFRGEPRRLAVLEPFEVEDLFFDP